MSWAIAVYGFRLCSTVAEIYVIRLLKAGSAALSLSCGACFVLVPVGGVI